MVSSLMFTLLPPNFSPSFFYISLLISFRIQASCFNSTLDNATHFITFLLCSLLPSKETPNWMCVTLCFLDSCLSAAECSQRQSHTRPVLLHRKPAITGLKRDLQYHLTISSLSSGSVPSLLKLSQWLCCEFSILLKPLFSSLNLSKSLFHKDVGTLQRT